VILLYNRRSEYRNFCELKINRHVNISVQFGITFVLKKFSISNNIYFSKRNKTYNILIHYTDKFGKYSLLLGPSFSIQCLSI